MPGSRLVTCCQSHHKEGMVAWIIPDKNHKNPPRTDQQAPRNGEKRKPERTDKQSIT